MSAVNDSIGFGNLGRMIAQRSQAAQAPEPPMACCPIDNEPLVATLEYRGAEFVCQVCGALYGWLSPRPLPPTEERLARAAELKAAYDADREARRTEEAPPT